MKTYQTALVNPLFRVLSAFIFGICLVAPATAQLNFADFNSGTGNLSFVQDATAASGKIRVNNDFYSRGAVWFKTAQPVRNGFVCMFTFRIANPAVLPNIPPDYTPQGGADGFAFVIQGAGLSAIGNAGGQMGYGSDLDDDPVGISSSLALEFDTYNNPALNDPDGNHISLHNLGQSPSKADENVSSLGRAPSSVLGINLKDAAEHTVRIEYDGTTMKVFVDNLNTPKITAPVNFGDILGSATDAFIGFTGGTGAEKENHEILSWSFSPKIDSPTFTNGTAPDADGGSTPAFMSSDYHPDSDANNFVTTLRRDTSVRPDQPTELWAKYYFPSNMNAGPYPLAVLLAGNHDPCGYFPLGSGGPRVDNNTTYTTTGSCSTAGYVVAPSHQGYDYMAQKLASRGYIVASINSNLGINSAPAYVKSSNPDFDYSDDSNLILARGRLVLRHLQQLSEWNKGIKPMNLVNTLGTVKKDFSGFMGAKITVGAQAIRVRSIGRMFLTGNSRAHALKIVRASDNVTVANTSITMTAWTPRQFKYASLATPVNLDANTSYYIVSEEKRNQDTWFDSTSIVASTGDVTIDSGIQSANGTTWTNPGGTGPFGPVDIMYEPLTSKTFTAVPTAALTERSDLSAKVGMKFTTGAQAVKIISLGRLTGAGNSQTHNLSIVRVSDKVVVATVTVNMAGAAQGSFKYANLSSPVTLAPNTAYYLVSQETVNGDKWADIHTSNNPTNVATINGGVINETGAVWTESGSSGQLFGPVNFQYEDIASATPVQVGVNLKGKIDFNNVGLMGHSRGGEGMRAAYELYKEPGNVWKQRIPDSAALDNNGIKGIFEIAPSDRFVVNSSGTVLRELSAVGTAWSVLLPACDGDLFWLPGVKPFDRMSKLSTESPARLKSTFFVYGANHNAFNSQWHITDSWGANSNYPGGDGCLGTDNTALYLNPILSGGHSNDAIQQTIGAAAFLAFMRGNVGNGASSDFNRNFDPSYDLPASIASITKFERGFLLSPDAGQTRKINLLEFPAGSTNLCNGSVASIVCSDNDAAKIEAKGSKIQPRSDLTVINHDDSFTATGIIWNSPAPKRYFQANWSSTASDVSSFQTLDFRISRQRSTSDRLSPNSKNTDDPSNFLIQLVMSDGSVSTPVSMTKYSQIKGPVGTRDRTGDAVNRGELHPILKTVKIPLGDFTGANLSQLAGVRFIFSDTKTGAIFLSGVSVSK